MVYSQEPQLPWVHSVHTEPHLSVQLLGVPRNCRLKHTVDQADKGWCMLPGKPSRQGQQSAKLDICSCGTSGGTHQGLPQLRLVDSLTRGGGRERRRSQPVLDETEVRELRGTEAEDRGVEA